jgi:hypothetical protein
MRKVHENNLVPKTAGTRCLQIVKVIKKGICEVKPLNSDFIKSTVQTQNMRIFSESNTTGKTALES